MRKSITELTTDLHSIYISGSGGDKPCSVNARDTPRVAMLKQAITKSYSFMKNAIEDDKSNEKAVVDSQFISLTAFARRTSSNGDDANDALELLKKDLGFFTADQRKALRSIIVEHCTASDIHQPPATLKVVSKSQVHKFIYNYLPQRSWVKIRAHDGTTLEDKCDEVTDVTHAIGLDYPEETPTRLLIVGIVLTADGRPFSEMQAYDLLGDARKQIELKRKSKVPTIALRSYPEKVSEYLDLCPNAYDQFGGPPVSCVISLTELAKNMCKLSSRSTNKKVRDYVMQRPQRYAPSHAAPRHPYHHGPWGGYQHYSDFDDRRYERRPSQLEFYDDHRCDNRSRSGYKMLKDAVDACTEDFPGDRSSREPPALMDRADDGASPGTETVADDSHGIDSMIAATAAKKTGRGKAMKRPAGKAMKRPAGKADVVKRPAGKAEVVKKGADKHLYTTAAKQKKLKGGWVHKKVQRGGERRHESYSLYTQR